MQIRRDCIVTGTGRATFPLKRNVGTNFEELIETLSKGSATAVTTLESNVAELNALKEYLYVQTPKFFNFCR